MCWLSFLSILPKSRVTWEEGISTEEFFHPIGWQDRAHVSMRHSQLLIMWGNPAHCELFGPGLVGLGRVRKAVEQGRKGGSKQAGRQCSSSMVVSASDLASRFLCGAPASASLSDGLSPNKPFPPSSCCD
jgi:hypothetical protein